MDVEPSETTQQRKLPILIEPNEDERTNESLNEDGIGLPPQVTSDQIPHR